MVGTTPLGATTTNGDTVTPRSTIPHPRDHCSRSLTGRPGRHRSIYRQGKRPTHRRCPLRRPPCRLDARIPRIPSIDGGLCRRRWSRRRLSRTPCRNRIHHRNLCPRATTAQHCHRHDNLRNCHGSVLPHRTGRSAVHRTRGHMYLAYADLRRVHRRHRWPTRGHISTSHPMVSALGHPRCPRPVPHADRIRRDRRGRCVRPRRRRQWKICHHVNLQRHAHVACTRAAMCPQHSGDLSVPWERSDRWHSHPEFFPRCYGHRLGRHRHDGDHIDSINGGNTPQRNHTPDHRQHHRSPGKHR